MNSNNAISEVSAFMQSHASGWIREPEMMSFFREKCSFVDVCTALTRVGPSEEMELMLQFLENAARFESVGLQLADPSALGFVSAALQSPSERLRGIIVTALHSVKGPSFPFQVDQEVLFTLLSDEDTGISLRTSKLLVHWSENTITKDVEKMEFAMRLIQLYNTRLSRLNETQIFRFISLFIELSQINTSIFTLVRDNKLFDPIVARFLSSESDLLVKLGSLTLIESLSQFENGQRYLAESNVLHALETELTAPLADSTTQISLLLTIASIVPFVSSTEQVRSILVYPQAHIPRILSHFIVTVNNAERMCAMKVISQLSVAANSSEPVQTFLRAHWRVIKEMTFALSDVDVEVVNTALDSVRSLIKNWERNPYMESEEIQGRVVTEVLKTFKRHPFTECRCLVYSLISAIIMDENLTDLALSMILTDPSPIRAALLDYQSESTYDSRRAKCDLVRVLVRKEPKTLLNKFFKKDEVENFIDFADKGLEWVPVTQAKDEMETQAL
jgi:hypothetical protein